MPVSVQPGNEAQGVGFDLKPVHAVRVRGRIINQVTGRPPDNGYVTLLPRDTDSRTRKGLIQLMPAAQTGAGVRDEQGDFEIEGVPSGSYWLYGGSQEKDRRYQGRAPVEVGNTDVQGVELTVSAGTTLTGRVRNEPSRAFDLSKLAIAISTADGMGSAATQARRDGTFVLESVANGSCRLNVSGFPEQYYVKSASLGGTDVLESGLTIDSGGAAAPDIVLIPSGGSISGTVLKDHQPTQSTVFLVPDATRRDRQDLQSKRSRMEPSQWLACRPAISSSLPSKILNPICSPIPASFSRTRRRDKPFTLRTAKASRFSLELISADGPP